MSPCAGTTSLCRPWPFAYGGRGSATHGRVRPHERPPGPAPAHRVPACRKHEQELPRLAPQPAGRDGAPWRRGRASFHRGRPLHPALDWQTSDLNHQVGYADLLLTRLGVKYLVVDAKRPGAMAWHQAAVDAALEQATRYAVGQGVRAVAVSDGQVLYAADPIEGGQRGRALVRLDDPIAPAASLWWLSRSGGYPPVDPAAPGAPSASGTAPSRRWPQPIRRVCSILTLALTALLGSTTLATPGHPSNVAPALSPRRRAGRSPARLPGGPVHPHQLPRGDVDHGSRAGHPRRSWRGWQRRLGNWPRARPSP